MSDTLIETVEDGVAVLTMNRPDRRNAMNQEMLAAMREVLPRLARDKDVGCVVLTGANGAFCAGGDVKGMAASNNQERILEEQIQDLRTNMEVSAWLHEMPKPTIAIVRGAAAGAGLSLALACDLRVAADTAKITTAFANVGFSGDFGGSYFLTKILGTARARELYYLPRVLSGDEAAALGLVNQAVADAEAEATGMDMARRIAAGPRIAYRYMKRNMNAAEYVSMRDALDYEASGHARCGLTEDHKNAAIAFAEKRQPVFAGR